MPMMSPSSHPQPLKSAPPANTAETTKSQSQAPAAARALESRKPAAVLQRGEERGEAVRALGCAASTRSTGETTTGFQRAQESCETA